MDNSAGTGNGDTDEAAEDLARRQKFLTDSLRLAAVHGTGLLDTEVEEVFDRLTRMGVRLLGVPAAFISLVDADRDFYKSACGFGEPLAATRELTGPTFCHYTVQRSEPLVIPDTKADPLYSQIPTVQTLGVAAYVGVPLNIDGHNIGAFCAIDTKPREWTNEEVDTLVELAASAQREVELRAAVKKQKAALTELEASRADLESSNRLLTEQAEELEMQSEQLLATQTDLQERTEQAESANLAKSGFLSMMSHELRTPLNAITGYADLLGMGLKGPITEEQLEFLNRIQKASRHLQALIGDLLEFSRLDAGRIEYEIVNVPVEGIISDVIELLTPMMTEETISFTRERAELMDGEEAFRVAADADRVRQILINLLTNAIKFSPQHGRVCIRTEATQDRVGLSVIDNGRGIPEDQLGAVFEPFVQVDRSKTAAQHQGVGLGLAICKELAIGMKGSLVVESEVDVGSTFTLWLPRC
ncbi:MAG TPA: GAF domain-containing sensor histidine kinase [Gemmatimonadaceae bacterium]|nr:GAF domain-containing sensor histidine kinase [Gemmatimonadaceae bacterium]